MLRWSLPLKRVPPTAHPLFGCAAGPVKYKIYVFGGFFYDGKTYSKKDQIDVHVFNTVTLCWVTLTPVTTERGECSLEAPSMRCGHTAVLIDHSIYVWGGIVNCKTTEQQKMLFTVMGDWDNTLYAIDVDTHSWFKPNVSGTVPEAKSSHSTCVLGKNMFIHGGLNQLGECTDGIFKLDTSIMVWSLINSGGTPPTASWGHSATVIGTKMFVFGGVEQQVNRIRVFDIETNQWMSVPSAQLVPEQRRHHAAFAYNGELYIIGGISSGGKFFSDLWKLNSKTFSWKKVEPKGKVLDWSGGMRCLLLGDQIILSGSDLVIEILHLSPSLKTLCKLAVIQSGLDQSVLPHIIRWELAAMTTATRQIHSNTK